MNLSFTELSIDDKLTAIFIECKELRRENSELRSMIRNIDGGVSRSDLYDIKRKLDSIDSDVSRHGIMSW